MNERKTVGLGVMLTLIHGYLLCDIGEVYEALNFLTGENLFTHQLPRAMRAAEPYLRDAFPTLCSDLVAEEVKRFCGWLHGGKEQRMSDIAGWLELRGQGWGTSFELSPLLIGNYAPQDPLSELRDITRKPVVVVAGGAA